MQLTASNVRLVAVVLTALCAVSGGIYLVFCKRKDYRRAFAYKGTAGLCFVVLGLLYGEGDFGYLTSGVCVYAHKELSQTLI